MALDDYEQIEKARRAAWKQLRLVPWGSTEHAERELRYEALVASRASYLRDLLSRLPFRWHIAHAYTPQETASYGGADHIVLDEDIHIGRLRRAAGDALSRPRAKFWGLSSVEDDRLPTALADIKIAERIVSGLKASSSIGV